MTAEEFLDAPEGGDALASTFADPGDVARYRRAKAAGATDQQAFATGDNGVGAWGDDTTSQTIPMVSLPRDLLARRFGHEDAAGGALVEITGAGGRSVLARIADKMPATAHIRNGAGIDLNPAAARLAGHPGDGLAPVRWRFVEPHEVPSLSASAFLDAPDVAPASSASLGSAAAFLDAPDAPETSGPAKLPSAAAFLDEDPPEAQQPAAASAPLDAPNGAPGAFSLADLPPKGREYLHKLMQPNPALMETPSIGHVAANAAREAAGGVASGEAALLEGGALMMARQDAATPESVNAFLDKQIADRQKALDEINALPATLQQTDEIARQREAVGLELKRLQAKRADPRALLPGDAPGLSNRDLLTPKGQQARDQRRQEAETDAEAARLTREDSGAMFGQDPDLKETWPARGARAAGDTLPLIGASAVPGGSMLALGVAGLQAKANAYDEYYTQAKSQAAFNEEPFDEARARREAQQYSDAAALRTVPEMAAFLGTGKVAAGVVNKLLSPSAPASVRFLASAAASTAANAAAGTVNQLVEQEAANKPLDASYSLERGVQDTLFGVMHGWGAGAEARSRGAEAAASLRADRAAVEGPNSSVESGQTQEAQNGQAPPPAAEAPAASPLSADAPAAGVENRNVAPEPESSRAPAVQTGDTVLDNGVPLEVKGIDGRNVTLHEPAYPLSREELDHRLHEEGYRLEKADPEADASAPQVGDYLTHEESGVREQIAAADDAGGVSVRPDPFEVSREAFDERLASGDVRLQAPAPARETSTSNASTADERSARGFPAAEQAAARDFGSVWDEAKATVQDDPNAGHRLVEELAARPRALTDRENALLLHRQIGAQAEHDAAVRAVNEAPDETALANAKTRLAGARDDLWKVYEAGRKAGTETARGLNARKMLASEQYSLGSMLNRRRAANDGKPLSAQQAGEVEAAHRRLTDLQAKLDANAQARREASNGRGAPADLEAEHRAELEREGRAAIHESGGVELLDAVRQAGGLPTNDPVFRGELSNVREASRAAHAADYGGTFNLFRRDAPTLDELTDRLRAQGFAVETPGDLLDLLHTRVMNKKPVYGFEARGAANSGREAQYRRTPAAPPRTPEELQPLRERWMKALQTVAPKTRLNLEVIHQGTLDAMGAKGSDKQAARLGDAIYLSAQALRANSEEINRVNLHHEIAHVFEELLSPSERASLERHWRQEVTSGKSPLHGPDGKLRPDVDPRAAHDFSEWFAERVGWENARHFAGEPASHTPVSSIAARIRQLVTRVWRTLRPGITPEEINAKYRDWLAGGAETSAVTGGRGAQAAIRPRTDYVAAVRDFFAGRLPANAVLELGRPGEILRRAGLENLPIRVRQSVLRVKTGKHLELDQEAIERLPELINRPLFVFDATGDRTGKGIVSQHHFSDGRTLTVYANVKVDSDGAQVHRIKTVFGKDAAEIAAEIQRSSNLRYADPEKAPAWAKHSARLDAPSGQLPALLDKINAATRSGESQGPQFARRKIEPAESAGAGTDAQKERAARLWREQGVESPFFKRWFGGSKITRADGSPMIASHSGGAGIEAFHLDRMNPTDVGPAGFYFSPEGSEGYATGENRPQKYKAYLNIKKPFTPDEPLTPEFVAKAREMLGEPDADAQAYIARQTERTRENLAFEKRASEKYGVKSGLEKAQAKLDALEGIGKKPVPVSAMDWLYHNYIGHDPLTYKGEGRLSDGTVTPGDKPGLTLEQKRARKLASRDFLESMGYDGMTKAGVPGSPWAGRLVSVGHGLPDAGEIIAFRPEQIKSVENHGTFDPEDSRIRFARRPAPPARTPEAARLERLKKSLTERRDELMRRMRDGDLTKRERVKTALDAEALRLKAEHQRAKDEFDMMVERARLRNRSALQRVTDGFVQVERAFKLTGAGTLAKLSGAATARMGITPAEEIVGAAYAKLPILREVVAKAPREGGISLEAERAALGREGFIKGIGQMGNMLRSGRSDLDVLHDHRPARPHNKALDLPGAIHGAIKNPVKYAEFARSKTKRTAFYRRAGLDVTNPLVEARIAAESYQDAQRAIFMQQNPLNTAYRNGIRALERSKTAPNLSFYTAKAMEFLLPVVKVPTNIIGESMTYAGGLESGAIRLANAMRKGLDTLAPEQADLIMRELKKGTLGTALLALGFLGYQNVGGIRQDGDKRKEGDLKPGDARMWGVTIPKKWLHAPAFEVLNMGASIRRVAEQNEGKPRDLRGLSAGALAAVAGVLREVPFVGTGARVDGLLSTGPKGDYQRGQLARSTLVPLGVQDAAQWMDKRDAKGEPVKRQPGTLLEQVEMGVPGLRQNVPYAARTVEEKEAAAAAMTPEEKRRYQEREEARRESRRQRRNVQEELDRKMRRQKAAQNLRGD